MLVISNLIYFFLNEKVSCALWKEYFILITLNLQQCLDLRKYTTNIISQRTAIK